MPAASRLKLQVRVLQNTVAVSATATRDLATRHISMHWRKPMRRRHKATTMAYRRDDGDNGNGKCAQSNETCLFALPCLRLAHSFLF